MRVSKPRGSGHRIRKAASTSSAKPKVSLIAPIVNKASKPAAAKKSSAKKKASYKPKAGVKPSCRAAGRSLRTTRSSSAGSKLASSFCKTGSTKKATPKKSTAKKTTTKKKSVVKKAKEVFNSIFYSVPKRKYSKKK